MGRRVVITLSEIFIFVSFKGHFLNRNLILSTDSTRIYIKNHKMGITLFIGKSRNSLDKNNNNNNFVI